MNYFITRRLLIVIICVAFSCFTRGQDPTGNPIVDAPILSGWADKLTDPATRVDASTHILALINKYVPAHDGNALLNIIAGNSFLSALNLIIPGTLFPAVAPGGPANTPFIFTNQAPGLSANNAAAAIGTFIAGRFKQEIEISFLQHFKQWIDKEVIIGALLPETKKVLTTYEPYQYTTFLQALDEGFSKDVANLPPDLQQYLANPDSDPTILGGVSLKPYYYPMVYLFKVFLEVHSLGSILNEVNSWTDNPDPLFSKIPASIQNYLLALSVLSNTFTDPATVPPAAGATANTVAFLNTTAITIAFQPQHVRFFIGLFLLNYQSTLKTITFAKPAPASNTTFNLYDLVNGLNTAAKINEFIDWAKLEYTSINATDAAFKKIAASVRASQTPDRNDEEQCIDSLVASAKHILNFPFTDYGFSVNPTILADANTVVSLIGTAGDLYLDFQAKSYGLVLAHIVQILQNSGIDNKTLTLIARYGNFAVSVVAAKNQQDVETALEGAALPVGSYAIKRNAIFSVELNSYAGIFGGIQTYSEANLPQGIRMTTKIGGFTAPVGISLSWGVRKSNTQYVGCSNSIFVPVIDVGAITAFKLQNDATSTLPSFSWNNILAPGIYYVHGIKNSVLSYGIGAQYGPELRSINGSATQLTPAAWSARVFFAADIPFFNFYSRTDKGPKE